MIMQIFSISQVAAGHRMSPASQRSQFSACVRWLNVATGLASKLFVMSQIMLVQKSDFQSAQRKMCKQSSGVKLLQEHHPTQ